MKLAIPPATVQLAFSDDEDNVAKPVVLTITLPSALMRSADMCAVHDSAMGPVTHPFSTNDRHFLRRLSSVTGWTGVTGEDDKPVKFSPWALEQLLRQRPEARNALAVKLTELYSVGM